MRLQGKNPQLKVPTTFDEMFLFNAAVMGYANSTWMKFILEYFDPIVSNVANSYRLQEECDVLLASKGLEFEHLQGGRMQRIKEKPSIS